MDHPREKRRLGPVQWGLNLRRPQVPSWLLSLAFHLVLFILLGFALRLAPRQGVMAERTADVGIVLKHQEGETEYYEGPSDVGQAAPATTSAATSSLADLFNAPAPVDPSSALPEALGVIGPSALADAGPGHAGGALEGPSGPPGTSTYGGKAETRVFGIEGEGYKFAYVFDRSASMGGSGRSALSAAKSELLASLDSLDTTHQFQIIFYNETPSIFNPSGRPGRLAFADEATNFRRARAFVSQIIADGTTRHEDALLAAIRLQPDVIFFLTDADEPRLSARQLYEIQRRAAGIAIHTIEFGLGPKASSGNFLEKLARQNGGQYAYVDITRLLPLRQNKP